MAILNKLRRSGLVLFIVLGSLFLFVISDYLTSNRSRSNDGSVGSIYGKSIDYVEFDNKLNQTIKMYEDAGQPIDEAAKEQISTMVWGNYFQNKVVNLEYEKLGIDLCEAEVKKLLYSKDAHPVIVQNFSQQGSEFNPKNVIDFREKVAKKRPELMKQFDRLIEQVVLETKSKKYNALVAKSYYATKLDVEDEFYNNTLSAKGKAVTLSYVSINDKDIKVTDSDLKSYLSKHKEEFKQDASRDIEFAMWPILPSKEDTLKLKQQLDGLAPKFASADDDSLFVEVNNSNTPYNNQFVSRGANPKEVENVIFNAPIDSVMGPIYYNGGFSLIKVKKVQADSVGFVHLVRAEVPVNGTTKADTAAAVAGARALLGELKASSNALDYLNKQSESGKVRAAYDMGWFREGEQTDDLNKAIKNMKNGDATVLSSKLFGVIILKMVDPRSNKKVQYAEVRQSISALKETEDAAYNKAQEFKLSFTNDKVDFEKMTNQFKIAKSVAKNIKQSARTFEGVTDAKEIVRWMYNEDTKKGDISEVFSLENKLVVAKLTAIRKEGTASLEDVREKLTELVLKEKKAEKLKEQFNTALKTAKSPEDLAIALKSIAQPFEGVVFAAGNVPLAGNDPKVVGFIMGCKEKAFSSPYASNDGVHVVYVEQFTKPEKTEVLKDRKMTLYSSQKSRVYETISSSLKKLAKVKDERYKYY